MGGGSFVRLVFIRRSGPSGSDPLSRAFACGRGRVSAPARFARLIARARGGRRTHLACRLNRGRSAPGRRGRDAVHGRRFPWTHHSTVSENASHSEKYYINFSNNLLFTPAGRRIPMSLQELVWIGWQGKVSDTSSVTPPISSCPDLFHCCPVQIWGTERMAWIQPGFEGFGGIGTRIDARRPSPVPVIPGLVPGISLKRLRQAAVWIPGTSPGMTKGGVRASRARGGSQTPRARNPRRPPVQIRPMAEPDSSGLVPGIQAAVRRKRWREIPGTSPGMTERRFRHGAGRRWRRCRALPKPRVGLARRLNRTAMEHPRTRSGGRGRRKGGVRARAGQPPSSRVCSLRRRILPVELTGRSGTNWTSRGTL